MSMRARLVQLLLSSMLLSGAAGLARAADEEATQWQGLALRSIGPAVTSGRVAEFAVHPEKPYDYYVATASSGLWHTANGGVSWTPLFDDYGSYALGTIAMDPENPQVLWVGTGENNAQRSVGYGDGVYRSLDGGRTFRNMGLGDSGHISQIGFDPRDSHVVYVAAQGPLWSAGGDRGLYRSEDHGESWESLLPVDEYTGANEFAIHPERPDHLVVSTYQRHRAIWTLINGGPGSGLHKSTDGGRSWRKLTVGLPGKDPLGRIGLAMAPSDPDMLYAIIEGSTAEESGIWRSQDFGETWEKRSGWQPSAPFYYQEIEVDPHDPERLYAVDTFTSVSDDGGRTFSRLSVAARHVDDHAVWINPADTRHLRIGGDGGVYESFDRGATFRHVRNLPLAQFYRVTPDNDVPFYSVYGGTQDNNTLGAPVRTTSEKGITNADWLFTLGGDGFKPQIDPENPNIIYSQYQYGNLARFDKRTGERVFISPQPAHGEPALRWNWNSPLIISPHDPARLYYAAEKVFRSDDRGDSWRPVSGNLSRQIDRNALRVMGRIWSVDAVAKNTSTSVYGSVVALDESPLVEGLLYAGTDDGLIQISEDGGAHWRRVADIPGAPSMALVEDLVASRHDADTAYAVFDQHKRGDYRPYVFRTRDRGHSWEAISANLPMRGSAHTLAEDHVDPQLLFVGTEFGLYASQNGGERWFELRGNMPTIAVRDLEIQRRENDLVVATFGRGIYILDDYSPLRTASATLKEAPATLFPVKDAWAYIERSVGPKPGDDFYAAENPPFGAVFRYYLRDGFSTLREQRRERERALEARGADTPYPSWEALRAEDREQPSQLLLTVYDTEGAVVRRVQGAATQGLHRVAWDLRYPAPDPVQLGQAAQQPPWRREPVGPMVAPGEYRVTLAVRTHGELRELAPAQSFHVKALPREGGERHEPEVLLAFEQQTAQLKRAVDGTVRYLAGMDSRVDHLRAALSGTAAATESERSMLEALAQALAPARVALLGDRTVTQRQEPAPWSIVQRVNSVVYGHWNAREPVTQTHRRAYEIAAQEFAAVLATLHELDGRLRELEQRAEALQAPYTPGRLPQWQPD